MANVANAKLQPFVAYLTKVYDNLQEVSEISGIDYELLHSITEDLSGEVEPEQAKRIVDFLLAHRRKTADVFLSFDEDDVTPRFPNQETREMRDKENRMLRREKKKLGW